MMPSGITPGWLTSGESEWPGRGLALRRLQLHVEDPEYVNGILDRLRDEKAEDLWDDLVRGTAFAYELEKHPMDVHSVSARSRSSWTRARTIGA